MTAAVAPNWQSENQAYLTAALATVKLHLRRHAEHAPDPERKEPRQHHSEPIPSFEAAHAASATLRSTPPALETLCTKFNLSQFERDVILLCAGIELDSAFARLCAAAQGNHERAYPTFSLALAALPDAHWSALSPQSTLRKWRLIEIIAGTSLTTSPLRIDERVLHFLTGVPYMDERLAGLVEIVEHSSKLAPSHGEVAEGMVTAWRAIRRRRDMPIVQLFGPDQADRRAVAVAAATSVGLRVAVLPADMVPTVPAEWNALLRLWDREATFGGIALLVEGDDPGSKSEPAVDAARSRAVGRFVERGLGPLILSDRECRRLGRPSLNFEVLRPTTSEQRDAWRNALGALADTSPQGIDALTAQFSLSVPTIHFAAAEVISRAARSATYDIDDLAWDVCRSQSRTRLDDLAVRVDPIAKWDDLVLSAAQIETLHHIAHQVRQRAKVYDTWGFGGKSTRGLGISALFAGHSGTGKTMASEVLANELKLDLYRIDLSAMVSKYIGETEKNLRRVFDAAEEGGAILLFDEADALFGKRSEVNDSHDRYANIEVSYLLQRMETYRGLAILTTNMKTALDQAFLRRLRFVVQFPFPDLGHRADIWRRIFPATTPTDKLDPMKLAKLNVAGGNIRNIAMNAAFLAAQEEQPVQMRHLCMAARIEYGKLDRTLSETEIGGWV
jgi:hypothetical protein